MFTILIALIIPLLLDYFAIKTQLSIIEIQIVQLQRDSEVQAQFIQDHILKTHGINK